MAWERSPADESCVLGQDNAKLEAITDGKPSKKNRKALGPILSRLPPGYDYGPCQLMTPFRTCLVHSPTVYLPSWPHPVALCCLEIFTSGEAEQLEGKAYGRSRNVWLQPTRGSNHNLVGFHNRADLQRLIHINAHQRRNQRHAARALNCRHPYCKHHGPTLRVWSHQLTHLRF